MSKEEYSGMWVFAEQQNGVIEGTVLELLAKALELKAHNGEQVTAVLLGSGVEELIPTLFSYGAEKVIVADDPALKSYGARPYQAVLSRLAAKYKPSMILYGATPLGRDLAPRVMVSLGTGLTADAIDLGYDGDGDFYQTTPAYGGKILAHIVIRERRPQMATVHPNIFTPIAPVPGASGELVRELVEEKADDCYQVLEVLPVENTSRLPYGSRRLAMRRWPTFFRYAICNASGSPQTPYRFKICATSSEEICWCVISFSRISAAASSGTPE